MKFYKIVAAFFFLILLELLPWDNAENYEIKRQANPWTEIQLLGLQNTRTIKS
jgi:hypothetical protein